MSEPAPAATKSAWWRTVLGEYPTGVTLITSLDGAGSPIGMIVGTFTAVSQNPPLVGFLADVSSSTYPKIARRGRFAASVLGTAHESLCRQFVTKDPRRFESGNFRPTDSGLLRLVDAIAWFDSAITQTVSLGDHDLVVGEVEDFGAGGAEAGYPLLFRRAGYGAFTVPAEEVDAVALGHHLRLAAQADPLIARLAEATGLRVMLSTVVRDRVIVLREHRGRGDAGGSAVGDGFPFAAPVAPIFVAWSPTQEQHAWIEGARHLVGSVDRAALEHLLQAVRDRGFSVSTDQELDERFRTLVRRADPSVGPYAQFWSAAAHATSAFLDETAHSKAHVTSIQAPVFDAEGRVILVVAVDQFGRLKDRDVDKAIRFVLKTASEITHLGGGQPPASYRPGHRSAL